MEFAAGRLRVGGGGYLSVTRVALIDRYSLSRRLTLFRVIVRERGGAARGEGGVRRELQQRISSGNMRTDSFSF